MRREYETPRVEVIRFPAEDVIRTSNPLELPITPLNP